MGFCLRLQSKQNLMQSMSLVGRLHRKHNLLMICQSDQCFSTSAWQNFDGSVLRAHQRWGAAFFLLSGQSLFERRTVQEEDKLEDVSNKVHWEKGEKISAQCFMESRTEISSDRLELKSQNKTSNFFSLVHSHFFSFEGISLSFGGGGSLFRR